MKRFFLIFFLFSNIFLLKPLLLAYYPDFSVHYDSARALLDGINPYIGGNNFFIPDVYPPFSQIIFIPFSLLPPHTAALVWTILSIAMYYVSLVLLVRLAGRTRNELYLLAGVLNVTFFPLKFTLGMGQINTAILLLFVAFLYFLLRKKRGDLAGLAVGMSLVLKLFPVSLPIYLILKKQYGAICWMTNVVLATILVSLVLFGSEIHFYFLRNVLPDLLGGWKDYYYNQSLTFPISKIFVSDRTRSVVYLGMAVIFVTPLFMLILKRRLSLLLLSTIITLTLLLSRFTWQHHLVLLIPSFIFVYEYATRNKNIMIWLFVSYVLVSVNIAEPLRYPLIIQTHAFLGMVLLYCLQLYILRRSTNAR